MAAPVKYTCNDIDALKGDIEKAQENLKHVFKYMDDLEHDLTNTNRVSKDDILSHIADMRYYIEDIETMLHFAPSALEDLRSANSALRDWGEEMENKVKELEDEIYRTQ